MAEAATVPVPEKTTPTAGKESQLLAELAEAKRQLLEIRNAKAQQAKKEEEDEVEKSGNVERLKKLHAEQLANFKKERAAEQKQYKQMLLETEVDRLAKSIGLPTELMRPHLVKRLDIDVTEGKPEVVVLDAYGKRTVNNVDALRQEFVENPSYADLIKSNKARGVGAAETGALGEVTPQVRTPETGLQPPAPDAPLPGSLGQTFLRPVKGTKFQAAGQTPWGGLTLEEFGQHVARKTEARKEWPPAMQF